MQSDRLNYAAEWAASAWNRLNLSLPVDLDTVRRSVKLYVRYMPLDERSGYIMQTPLRWYAIINSRDHHERRRFSLAHEIGEYLLKRYFMDTGRPLVIGHRQRERFCDRFACELLMPQKLVIDQAAAVYHGPDNDKTAVLAGRFGVSPSAMSVRLRELELNKRHIGRTKKYKVSSTIMKTRCEQYFRILLMEEAKAP